jgi:hypothetical protein
LLPHEANDEVFTMLVIYILLSFALVIGVSSVFWKIAARILRYGGVTWPLALLTATTIVFIGGLLRGLLHVARFSPPEWLGLVLGVSFTIAIGAWCFHDRAVHPDGKPVDWPGAFKLSGVAVGLNLVFALLLIAVGVAVES